MRTESVPKRETKKGGAHGMFPPGNQAGTELVPFLELIDEKIQCSFYLTFKNCLKEQQ
jgi:hypothetical protein